MKFAKYIILAAATAVALIAAPAKAQFDVWGATRDILLANATVLNESAPAVTNSSIDIHGYQGIAKLVLTTCTNLGAGALTVTPEMSDDNTNWVVLSSYAVHVSTSVIYTNFLYSGTNLVVANTFLLPGTLTTPTAATAGWASSYVLASPFTNSGALTVTRKGVYTIGFNVADAKRYLRTVWTPTGASSNATVSALFTGRRASEITR